MSKQKNKNIIKNLLLEVIEISQELLKEEHTIDCEFCINKGKNNCPKKRLSNWEKKASQLLFNSNKDKKINYHNTFKRDSRR